jgi:uncharacterized membrane protein
MSSRRAEAFSDGVFAVAITVLVFNLLGIGERGLGAHPYHMLLSAWPNYFAYAVSFLTIGIMWINHHAMFSAVTLVDRRLLIINLVLLMGVVAIPFPTALVAQELAARTTVAGKAGIAAAAAGGQAAAVAYGVVMIAISIGYSAMWMYISGHLRQLGAVRVMEQPRLANLQFSAGLLGYVAATLIAAFVSGLVALVIYGLLAIYYMFEHLPGRGGDPELGGTGVDGTEVGGTEAEGGREAS